MHDYYIGLMSGTSMDAVDAIVVDLSTKLPTLIATHSHLLPESYREATLRLIANQTPHPIQCYGELDTLFGQLFAKAVGELLTKTNLTSKEITAIGSHGQTIFHQPQGSTRFTLQIGDPNIIAQQTGITTVADFRRRDMAAGGQGAPLVPAFHNAIFGDSAINRVILNIGGMANITILPTSSTQDIQGFDTGPGNVLLDTWCTLQRSKSYDKDGEFATQGSVREELLNDWLNDPYFQKTPPKSTGREYFNGGWLLKNLPVNEAPTDVQATLVALTAKSIANDIQKYAPQSEEIIVCGGGAHNPILMRSLAQHLSGHQVISSADRGIDPDWVEAIAFAWLAKRTLSNLSGNVPSVTGATSEVTLGGIYPG